VRRVAGRHAEMRGDLRHHPLHDDLEGIPRTDVEKIKSKAITYYSQNHAATWTKFQNHISEQKWEKSNMPSRDFLCQLAQFFHTEGTFQDTSFLIKILGECEPVQLVSIDSMLFYASWLLRDRNADMAIIETLCRKAIELAEGKNIEALCGICKALHNQGKEIAARRLYERLKQKWPGHSDVVQLLEWLDSENLTLMDAGFGPTTIDLSHFDATANYYEKRFPNLRNEFSEWMEKLLPNWNPQSIAGHFCVLAISLIKHKRLSEAGLILADLKGHDLLLLKPQEMCRLGRLLVDVGQYQHAERLFQTANTIDPKCAAALYNLACLSHIDGDHSRAVDLCRRAIELGQTVEIDTMALFQKQERAVEIGELAPGSDGYCQRLARLELKHFPDLASEFQEQVRRPASLDIEAPVSCCAAHTVSCCAAHICL
jgi:tetratricopeptide (TPR) repeat protein